MQVGSETVSQFLNKDNTWENNTIATSCTGTGIYFKQHGLQDFPMYIRDMQIEAQIWVTVRDSITTTTDGHI